MKKFFIFRVFIFLSFATMALLALYQLDENAYQSKLWEEMQQRDHLSSLNPNLSRLAEKALSSNSDHWRQSFLTQLQEAITESLEEESPVIRLELIDLEQTSLVSASNTEKMEQQRMFRDVLFMPFIKRASINVRTANDAPDRNGSLVAHYTVPLNEPAIAEITAQYTLLAIGLFLLIMVPWVVIDKYFIGPQNSITTRIEESERVAHLIRPPRSPLERGYNNLARAAIIRDIEQAFQDPRVRLKFNDPYQAVGLLPEKAAPAMEYPWMASFTARASQAAEAEAEPQGESPTDSESPDSEESDTASSDSWIMTHRAVYAGVEGANTPAKEDIDAALVTKLLERVDTSQQEQTVEKMELSLGNRPATLCMVAFINEPNLCPDPTFVIAAMPPAASGSSEIWECQTLRLMLERIREQLALLNVQRQLLARERKEANVSLARNLGHDLTNIIATSKLDLLTLQRFAGRLTSQPITKAQQQAMDDTLKNLLNNARYMQEVVDIYRSFSYLNRPSYGEHDLNGLVKDIVSLFQLSTSLKLNVDLKLDPEIGMLELEPRLIKLALFNLLNNALDALQEYKNSVDTKTAKGSGVRHTLYQPEIRITSTPTSDGATLEIADNGPGIRDEKGQLMNSADVNRIFGLGYTTKAEGEGEGLGLSWVRTIILDFHGGNIQAENRDPQGAIFTLHFKSKADTKGTPSAMI